MFYVHLRHVLWGAFYVNYLIFTVKLWRIIIIISVNVSQMIHFFSQNPLIVSYSLSGPCYELKGFPVLFPSSYPITSLALSPTALRFITLL